MHVTHMSKAEGYELNSCIWFEPAARYDRDDYDV